MELIKTYKAKYLVHVPMLGFKEEKPMEELIQQVQEKFPGWLKPVYMGKDSRFVIFEIKN